MMLNLGDVPMEEITINHSVVNFMLSYKPPRTEPEARCELLRFRSGVKVKDSFYKSKLPVRVNTTYLLRSVHYGTPDALVAFHVSRQDTDGSLIIAWKLLKQYPPRDLDNKFVIRLNPTTRCSSN